MRSTLEQCATATELAELIEEPGERVRRGSGQPALGEVAAPRDWQGWHRADPPAWQDATALTDQ